MFNNITSIIMSIAKTVPAVLGVIAFFLSLYQWGVAQRQLRVTSAIEISKSYLQDQGLRSLQADIQKSGPTVAPVYDETNLKLRAFVDLNDYIAYLANEGLIDNEYISTRIKCDIAWLAQVAEKVRNDFIVATGQIRKYVASGRHFGCPEIGRPKQAKAL